MKNIGHTILDNRIQLLRMLCPRDSLHDGPLLETINRLTRIDKTQYDSQDKNSLLTRFTTVKRSRVAPMDFIRLYEDFIAPGLW